MTKPCARETCPGEVAAAQVAQGVRWCSRLCRTVDETLATAQNRDVSPAAWAALVLVADAVSDWRREVTPARRGRGGRQRR